MKAIHLYQAWKILPLTAKGLVVAGEAVSAIIYWAGTHADPNYGCLTDFCNVTRQNIELTTWTGIAFMILVAVMLIFSLIVIAFTLDKQQEKGKTFEELEKKVSGDKPESVPQ